MTYNQRSGNAYAGGGGGPTSGLTQPQVDARILTKAGIVHSYPDETAAEADPRFTFPVPNNEGYLAVLDDGTLLTAAEGATGFTASSGATLPPGTIVDVTPTPTPADPAALETALAAAGQPADVVWQSRLSDGQIAQVVGGAWTAVSPGSDGATTSFGTSNTVYDLLGFPPADPLSAPATPADGDTHIERYQNGMAFFDRVAGAWQLTIFQSSDDPKFTHVERPGETYVDGSLAGPQAPPVNPDSGAVHAELYDNALVFFNYLTVGGWDGNNITYAPLAGVSLPSYASSEILTTTTAGDNPAGIYDPFQLRAWKATDDKQHSTIQNHDPTYSIYQLGAIVIGADRELYRSLVANPTEAPTDAGQTQWEATDLVPFPTVADNGKRLQVIAGNYQLIDDVQPSPLLQPATAYLTGQTVSALWPVAEGGDDTYHRFISLADRTSTAVPAGEMTAAEYAAGVNWQDLGASTLMVASDATTAGAQGEVGAPPAGHPNRYWGADATWHAAPTRRTNVTAEAGLYTYEADNPLEPPLEVGDWIWVETGGELGYGAYRQVNALPVDSPTKLSGWYGDILLTGNQWSSQAQWSTAPQWAS